MTANLVDAIGEGMCPLRSVGMDSVPTADPGPPSEQFMRMMTSCCGTPTSSLRGRWKSSYTGQSSGGGTRRPGLSSQREKW